MHQSQKNARGSVLLVTMCFVAVLAIALTSYIGLSSLTMNVSNRSYQTGVSEQVAEMGLELALHALNTNNWSGWDTATTPNTAALTVTFPSTKYGSSGITTKINLEVQNYNAPTTAPAWSAATTYAVGNVVSYRGAWYSCILSHINQAPPNATYWSSAPMIYSEGVATLPDSAATTIKTQLRAAVASATLFPNAIAGSTSVSFASSGTVDSYNRNLGTYASQYGGSTNYSAVVAAPTVTISGATVVQGYVASPNFTYNVSNTVVESQSSPPTPKVDPKRVSSSVYVPLFDPQSVSSSMLINMTGSGGTTLSLPRGGDTAAADGKYYYYTSSTLSFSNNDTLNINAPCVIDIRPTSSAGISINGTGQIVIAATGASLELHFGGELFIGSNAGGGIRNLSTDPKKCILIGTSTYNSAYYHYFWTIVPFYGVIYMPYAYVHMWNSGYTSEVYGAISASNVYFNHPALLHYDSSLRSTTISGADAPVIITEWRELTDPAEKVVFP